MLYHSIFGTTQFGTSGGQVSVNVTSNGSGQNCGCNWACPLDVPPVQVNVQNQPTQVTTLPTVFLCAGETFDFCGQNFAQTASPICTQPGDCDHATQQPIVLLPTQTVDLGKHQLCGNQCFTVGGQDFCDPGFFTVKDKTSGTTCNITSFSI